MYGGNKDSCLTRDGYAPSNQYITFTSTGTTDEKGSHSHSFTIDERNTSGSGDLVTKGESQAHKHYYTAAGTISSNGSHTHTITMQNPDNGINSGEDRNIPPYQGVYIWERYE